MDRGAWRATVHEIARVGHNLAIKPPPLFMYYLKALKSFGLWKESEDKNKGFIFNGIFWNECFYICAHIHFANIVSQLETSLYCGVYVTYKFMLYINITLQF